MATDLKQKIGQGCALALFQSYEKEPALLEKIYHELSQWLQLFDTYPVLRRCVESPLFSKEDKRKVMEEVLHACPTKPFVELLIEKNLLSCLEETIKNFSLLFRNYSKITEIQVTTDILDEPVKKMFEEFFEKAFADSKTHLIFKESSDLYGGFIVETENFYWDHSLKGQLAALKAYAGK